MRISLYRLAVPQRFNCCDQNGVDRAAPQLTIAAKDRTNRALIQIDRLMAKRLATIPRYGLYGEKETAGWAEMIGFERIRERSAIYDFHIKPHRHEGLFQILYVQHGSGTAFADDRRWQLAAGSLVVVPSNTVHGFEFSSDIEGQVVTAAQQPLERFTAASAPGLLSTIRQPAHLNIAASPRHGDAIEALLDAIRRESQVSLPGQFAAGIALLLALFVQIARLHAAQKVYDDGAPSRRAMLIEQFRAMVDARFRCAMSISASAQELGITAGQLSRLCRDTLGMSSRDILNARILQEAERELIYSNLSVKQIAGTLGFEDDAYFGRFFRKHRKLTPLAFRRHARGQLARRPRAD